MFFTRWLQKNQEQGLGSLEEPNPEADFRAKFLRGVMLFWTGQLVCGGGWAIAMPLTIWISKSSAQAQNEAGVQTGAFAMAIVGVAVGMFFGTLLWMAGIPMRRPDKGYREFLSVMMCMLFGFSGALILYFQNKNLEDPIPLGAWFVYIGVVLAITILYVGYCRYRYWGLFIAGVVFWILGLGVYIGFVIQQGTFFSLPNKEVLTLLFLTMLWWPVPLTLAVLQYLHLRWVRLDALNS